MEASGARRPRRPAGPPRGPHRDHTGPLRGAAHDSGEIIGNHRRSNHTDGTDDPTVARGEAGGDARGDERAAENGGVEGAAGGRLRALLRRAPSWLLPLTLLLLLLLAYLAVPPVRRFLNEATVVLASAKLERIRAWLQHFGSLLPLAFVALLLLQVLLPPVPALLAMVVAVLAFGPLWGGLLAFAGALLAALAGYLVGRVLTPGARALPHGAPWRGFWTVALLRATPPLSSEAVALLAGALAMPPLAYALASALGLAALAALVALLAGEVERLRLGLLWATGIGGAGVALHLALRRWWPPAATSASPEGDAPSGAGGGAGGDRGPEAGRARGGSDA